MSATYYGESEFNGDVTFHRRVNFFNNIQCTNVLTSGSFVGNGTIPIGGIIMWSGTIANVPTGWALCNGSNGTPDLRNRFIVGATSDASTGVTFNANTGAVSGSYAPGNTGGSVAHQLTIAELASHYHDMATYNGVAGPYEVADGGYGIDYGVQAPPTTSVGGNNYHENRPPYYALAFIMRVA